MAALTKAELKEALQLKGVPVPPGSYTKDALVRLYREHIPGSDARLAAGLDFSSDEEQDSRDVVVVSPEVRSLTNDDLFAKLREFGYPVGPVVDSTRGLYEKRLQQFLSSGQTTPARTSGRSAAAEFSATEEEEDDDEGTPLQDVPVSRLGLSGGLSSSSRGEAPYSPGTSSGGGHVGHPGGLFGGGQDSPVVSRTSATFTTAGTLRARAGAQRQDKTTSQLSATAVRGGGLSLGAKVATVAALVAAVLLVYANLEYFKADVPVPSVIGP